ncbi:MAG: Trk system potassium transporter TrkA [Ruminococcaceae bacterium]|nr:Trk system potassium transporter TrkA [Oscillospiraceae bacterium]
MKIIVVGCGKIGTNIIGELVKENHDVVAIDKSPAIIEEITTIYDVMGVVGNGADCETLEEAGVDEAELLISVTDSDEMNMLSCFLAGKMGASHTIARIRNPEYNDKSLGFMKEQLSLSMAINPELNAARELYRLLKLPSAAKIETFSGRNFEMVEIKLKADSALDGLSLIEFRKKYQINLLICVVKRDDEVYIPDGNFVLKSGDRICVTARPAEIMNFFKILGTPRKRSKNIMILGASKTAFYLAKMLLDAGSNVKIIDLDGEKCAQFSESLPNAVIIHGDGARQELLLEEGIQNTDAFISLTGMDEENILISYFAASQNVPQVITKANREEFVAMAQRLGLDTIVTPKKLISDVMVSYARGLQNSLGSKIETLYKIMDGNAELLEFIAQSDCSLNGIAFKDLKIKKSTRIAGIIRGRKTIIPSGEDCMLSGDKVIVVTAIKGLDDLNDIAE